ncbi:MAG TPA: GWxTD domain-containing protein [Candidatus Solibacter sp.]|nr:GWxTD domain-containing protein [Candidatus Solibacter sp.]
MNATRQSISCLSLSVLLGVGIFAAPQKDDKKKAASAQRETVAKPMSERERRRKEEKLRKELETPYRKWLNEDVAYIITDEERTAFKRLQTDEEREQFIENFWLRRDPTPDTIENEFKEEHYRRIAYANENFASGIPGWKTDRGRIYITYGPPDEKESHPSGGSYERPPEEGGGTTSTFPFEQWRYRYIEGVGSDIIIEFVDPTMSGEYRMTMDPSEKDALLYVPNAGLTLMEQLGMSSKTDRFNRTDGTHLGVPFGAETEKMNQFNRLEQFAKLQRPPAIKFHDLEAAVNSVIKFNILPLRVRADFFPVTEASVLTFVTLQFDNKDLQFVSKEGVQRATVNIFGKVSTMTRRVVTNFEDTVTVDSPAEFLSTISQRKSIYNKTVPLTPGTYKLDVVCKDVTAGNIGTYQTAITVPRMDGEKLMASNIVLADLIEHVPTKSIGMGQFVIGTSKVRPRVDDVFKREEKMGIYFKIYNFGTQEGDNRTPSGEVTYEVVKNGTNEKIFEASEDVAKIPGASANQVTIEKILPLNSLAPGQYTLRVKITDKNRNQVLTPSAQFTVT